MHGLPTDVVNPSRIGVAGTDARCVNPLHHYLTAGGEWRAISINASHRSQRVMTLLLRLFLTDLDMYIKVERR